MDDEDAAKSGIPPVDAAGLKRDDGEDFKEQVQLAHLDAVRMKGAYFAVTRYELEELPDGQVAAKIIGIGGAEAHRCLGRTPKELGEGSRVKKGWDHRLTATIGTSRSTSPRAKWYSHVRVKPVCALQVHSCMFQPVPFMLFALAQGAVRCWKSPENEVMRFRCSRLWTERFHLGRWMSQR